MSKLDPGTLVFLPPWASSESVFGMGDVCVGVVCNVKKIALAGETYEVLVDGKVKMFHRDDLKIWKNGEKKKEEN